MALAMKNALKTFDRLKESGVPAKQARVIVESIEEAADFNIKELATKSDLKNSELVNKAEFAAVRSEMKEEFTAVRSEMRQEFANVRAEMSEMRAENKEMKRDIAWLQRLFMGGILLILVNIAITLMHH